MVISLSGRRDDIAFEGVYWVKGDFADCYLKQYRNECELEETSIRSLSLPAGVQND